MYTTQGLGVVPCLGKYVHKASLGNGTLLGGMCTQDEAWTWYTAGGDMYM